MLGSLNTYATTSAPRRVEPPGSAPRSEDTPEAGAPPRRTTSETDIAVRNALSGQGGRRRASRFSREDGLTARLARAALEGGGDTARKTGATAALKAAPGAAPVKAEAPGRAEAPVKADAPGRADAPDVSAAKTARPNPAAPTEAPFPAPVLKSEPLLGGLTEAEQEAVSRMADRDREVRAHEMAHVIAGRPWAGPPVYMYQTGPDGRRYAIGGFVPIDIAPVEGDPHATAYKMRVVGKAALASSDPSAADRRVAAIALAKLQEALAAIGSHDRAARVGATPEAAEQAAESGLNVRI